MTPWTSITDAETLYKKGIGQDIIRKFRDNDLSNREAILQLLAQSNNAIVDDFFYEDNVGGEVNTALYTMVGGSGSFRPNVGVDGKHILRLSTSTTATRGLHSKTAFRLNQDMVGFLEAIVQDVGGNAPNNMLVGFSDVDDASDESDVIGFLKGTTAGKWRFRTAKAGVANTTDNIGNRATWQALRIEFLKSGATLQVRAYIDGAEILNSPFTTLIPDTVALRLHWSHVTPAAAVDYQLDRWEFRWTAIPPSP